MGRTADFGIKFGQRLAFSRSLYDLGLNFLTHELQFLRSWEVNMSWPWFSSTFTEMFQNVSFCFVLENSVGVLYLGSEGQVEKTKMILA